MYFDTTQTNEYVGHIASLGRLASASKIDLFIIPDLLSIQSASAILSKSSKDGGANVLLGAQDCMWEESGPYTGEVSPKNLAQLGVKIIELGHAERRRLFGETNESVRKKAACAVKYGLIPLVCVGEVSKPPARGPASAAVGLAVREIEPQILSVLNAIPGSCEVIVAYEPVWAIGASQPADADHVCAVAAEIRRVALETGRRGRVRVLYGGSAGPGTFARLKRAVDGLFLGRFAHDVSNLKLVIEEMAEEAKSRAA